MAVVSYSIQALFNETTVNSTTGGDQSHADIAFLTNGDLVVTWQSDESSALTFQDVRGQRFNADGTVDGAEFSIQSQAADYESNPSVAALPANGEFVVVYEDTDQNDFTINTGGSGGGVDVNIRTSSGGTLPDFPFNPLAETDNQTAPAVAVNSAGQMAVVLLDQVAGSTSDNLLKLHLFNEGETEPFVTTNFVFSPGTTNILFPSVAALNNDTFVATWIQDDDPGAASDMNVYSMRFNTGGVLGGGPVLVNAETDLQTFPVVTGLADGGYVIVWMDAFNGSTTDTEIEYHIYNSDGTSRNYGSVYSPSGVRVDEISVSAISDGAFVVTFTEEAATENQVRGQIVGNDGNRWGDVFTIEDQQVSTANANQSTVAGIGGGNFITAWTDYLPTSADSSGSHIAMQGNTVVRLTNADVNETVVGDDLIDNMFGTSGNETLYGGANTDSLFGGEGNDMLFGGSDSDVLNGGTGLDYARYDDAAYGDLWVSLQVPALNTGAAEGDTFTEIEGLILGGGNDWIYGDAGANYLYGGSGNDNIFGSLGADYIHGGAGLDYARFDDAGYAGLVADLLGANTNTGAAAGDVYAEIEGLILTGNNDFGFGNELSNYIYGLGGDDYLDGRTGDDFLFGGTGNDTFHFMASYGRDTVGDFNGGTGLGDRLDLQGSFASFAAVLAASTQVGANLEIALNGSDVLVLSNFTISNFAADDVLI
ncbi:calcium-binding protein [Hoeflea sp.]|uniref:calcium-binding protein n=1 Tax=Hoeflea sp. TaxID=1940281 RepID=UPI003747C4F2